MKPKIFLVTPDFEQISTYKRKLIFNELLNPEHGWTLLFCTQRYYVGNFDSFSSLSRSEMKVLKGQQEFLKEIENHG